MLWNLPAIQESTNSRYGTMSCRTENAATHGYRLQIKTNVAHARNQRWVTSAACNSWLLRPHFNRECWQLLLQQLPSNHTPCEPEISCQYKTNCGGKHVVYQQHGMMPGGCQILVSSRQCRVLPKVVRYPQA